MSEPTNYWAESAVSWRIIGKGLLIAVGMILWINATEFLGPWVPAVGVVVAWVFIIRLGVAFVRQEKRCFQAARHELRKR